METPWHFLVNQFLNATRDNFKKALKLSNYHDAVLKKLKDEVPIDPDWAILYDRYHPLHVIYFDIYSQWKNAGGTQEGQTLNVDQLLILLKSKVNKWDAKVQDVFEKTTPEYTMIFPNAHYPFNSGDKDSRITAVHTLGLALNPYPALVITKTEVDAFHLLLDTARDTQESAIGGTKALGDQVDAKRIVIMEMQYANTGFLMNKYPQTPLVIAPVFELLLLRGHQQVLFTFTLEPAENEAVLIHTFVSDDKLRFKLTGTGQALFYLATTAHGTDSTPITINVDGTIEQVYEASAFAPADYGTHRYLTAVNNSPGANELHCEIELM